MKIPAGILLLLLLPGLSSAQETPVVLEEIISRENPDFSVEASLTIGRDGQVYLASGGNHSFTLRVAPDGTGKAGGPVTYALANATANAQGTIATASGHFAHKVTLYDPAFRELARVDDFLVNDQVGWDAPAHVEAGTGGDFYAVDQHRDRIVRMTPQGKTVTSYPIPHEPEGHPGLVEDFRVWEAGETFYLQNRTGQIRAVGFDGKKKWSLNANLGHRGGGFDVDGSGTFFAISSDAATVRKFSTDGKPAGEIVLKAAGKGVTELRISGQDLFVKRHHPTELFERYDLATGVLRNAAGIAHERLAVRFPKSVWTAGEGVPWSIEFASGGRPVRPAWRVWARPLRGIEYRELKAKDGSLLIPSDLVGLVQLKVTPEIDPLEGARRSEYLVRTVVEIRRAGAAPAIAVVPSGSRSHFARGEEVTFSLVGGEPKDVSKIILLEEDRTLLTLPADATHLGAAETAKLKPGLYHLAPVAQDRTAVPAAIVIGPGKDPTAYPVLQYGDYGPTYPAADPWSSPEIAERHARRTARLGVNLLVDRIGANTQIGDLAWSGRGAGDLEALRKKFPELSAVVRGGSTLLETMDRYSALGIQEMAILMYMDAGLPLGAPGFDNRKPEELTRAIARVTEALKPFPAFRGWSWASNWWIFEGRGAKAASTPEEKAACQAAVKRARETGAWDPVIDRVAERRLHWAVEAQDLFHRTLEVQAPGLVTAVAGPYRNVEAYPPITFSNVDEIDLQAQWEQIALPYHAPQSVDFYRRPGKRAWVHPEAWNDAGTGDQILPTLLSALLRGADGVGVSGPLSPWMTGVDGLPHDCRSAHYGTVSVFRSLSSLLTKYGRWWLSLRPEDPVAILADGRMLKIDDWLGQGVTGRHFARLLEAYGSCLFAHLPATYLFPEDLSPESLGRFKAVLVVGQEVELEPGILETLRVAEKKGVRTYYDGTCREDVVRGLTPLGFSFNRVEKDRHPASDDAAYWRFPAYLRETAPALRKAIGSGLPDYKIENDEVMVSERRADQGRVFFLVNNSTPAIEPGQLWRQTLCVATRVPVLSSIEVGAGAVYDAFALRKVEAPGGVATVDLRDLPGRILAVLPEPIARVDLECPAIKPGVRFAWKARVVGSSGSPLAALIPLQVTLRDGAGRTMEEWTGEAGKEGAQGSFLAPANADGLTVTAVELLSGQKAGGGSAPAPVDSRFGPHLRDIALVGQTAVVNAMNWDHNLYAVGLDTGKLEWRGRVGDAFAFAPEAAGDGFAVQAFHFDSAEGYELHLVRKNGETERRFGLYGLPGRLPHRFVPGIQRDRINHFAVSPDGSWVASAGDLGVAVWDRGGKVLWSLDWWKTRRRTGPVAAIGLGGLLVMDGMKAQAYQGSTGKLLWEVPLGPTGEALEVKASRDGRTQAVLASTEGGRIYLLRDGKLSADLPTGGGNAIDLSADGSRIALVTGNQLKLYSAEEGLQWILPGDDFLRFPRFSPDASRLAVSSDLGTLSVVGVDGSRHLDRDLGSVAALRWLPEGDLLVATWMGTVARLDAKGTERWRTLLRPEVQDLRARPASPDRTPLTRMTTWMNSEPTPGPITPNLLSEKEVLIKLEAKENHIQFVRSGSTLVDGKPDAAPDPWIDWGDVGSFAETSPFNAIVIDTFRTQLRVRAITFFEDPAHPESWLRDLRLEAWDPARGEWTFVHELRSDSPVHTHRLPKPVEAARFRLVLPWGVCGNIRLGEIVLEGEKLGGSHPDVIAKRPVAVLFDEGDDLKPCLVQGPLSFRFQDARSGGRCLLLQANGRAYPPFQPPFGHVIPNWDFEIVEKPEPGQYRWLQFSWRSLSPESNGITLSLGGANYGERALFHAGEAAKEEGSIPRKLGDRPPTTWETHRIDLWDFYRKPVRIRSMSVACAGGPVTFDQILLAREEKDLPSRN